MNANGFPGCVESTVTLRDGRIRDCNGFVTALAVTALRQAGVAAPEQMLDVLTACRSQTGGFRFWPAGYRPGWAPDLPDDADDTAIMTLELLRAGRLTDAEARRIACLSIGRHRFGSFGAGPTGWRLPGVFATWHRQGSAVDLIDCTATANVLALYAAVGLWHLSGVEAAVGMLADAIEWAGSGWERAQSLSPFYPEPIELVWALEHAVQAGAVPLGPLLALAARQPWARERERHLRGRPICSGPYGAVLWHSPALSAIRRRGAAKLFQPSRRAEVAEASPAHAGG
ncbi:MAG: hypothetical protein EOP82_30570 [Variovorax sp.]|nr:MAG: hypothetical protein EOP82_30570 [Variovorax sp.]